MTLTAQERYRKLRASMSPDQEAAYLERGRLYKKKARAALVAADPEKYRSQRSAEIRGWYTAPKQHLYKKQLGRCAICKTKLPVNKLHLDHDHTIAGGRSWRNRPQSWRGLLCRWCNVSLLPGYERVRHIFHLRNETLEDYLENPPAQCRDVA